MTSTATVIAWWPRGTVMYAAGPQMHCGRIGTSIVTITRGKGEEFYFEVTWYN